MKKEYFAGALLAAIIIAAFINIHYMSRLVSEIITYIDSAVESVEAEDWSGATEKAERAAELWRKSDSYTHIVLRHGEINSATDALYNLLSNLYAENTGEALGAAQMAVEFFRSIVTIEQVRFGSVF